jgi:hypothetical protein
MAQIFLATDLHGWNGLLFELQDYTDLHRLLEPLQVARVAGSGAPATTRDVALL